MAAVETKIEKTVQNSEENYEKVINKEGGDAVPNDGAKKQKKPKPNKKTGNYNFRDDIFFSCKHVVFLLKSYLFWCDFNRIFNFCLN